MLIKDNTASPFMNCQLCYVIGHQSLGATDDDRDGESDDDFDDFVVDATAADDDYRNKSSFDNGGGFSGGRLKTAGTSSDPALGST